MLDFISSSIRDVFSASLFGISFGDICLACLLFVAFLLIILFPFVILLSLKSSRGDE